MKLRLLALLMLIGLGASAQTTPWSPSPPVTAQTRTFGGVSQLRFIWGGTHMFTPNGADTTVFSKQFTGPTPQIAIKNDAATEFNYLAAWNDSLNFTKLAGFYYQKSLGRFNVTAPINLASTVYLPGLLTGSSGDSLVVSNPANGRLMKIAPISTTNIYNSNGTSTGNRVYEGLNYGLTFYSNSDNNAIAMGSTSIDLDAYDPGVGGAGLDVGYGHAYFQVLNSSFKVTQIGLDQNGIILTDSIANRGSRYSQSYWNIGHLDPLYIPSQIDVIRLIDSLRGVGYVPTSRQIINGYGIQGGHALSTDVTLAVDTTAIVSKATLAAYGYIPISHFVIDEDATGTKNGVNLVFTTTNIPITGKIILSLNGQKLKSGVGKDYTILGNTITLTISVPPVSTDVLDETYIY